MNTQCLSACVVFVFAVVITSISQAGEIQLTQAQALERAQQIHPSLGSAQAVIDREEGKFKQNISPANPQFVLSYEDNPRGLPAGTANRKIGIEQPIDFPAKYILRGSISSSEIESAEHGLALTKKIIRAQVKNVYFATLAKKIAYQLGDSAVSLTNEFATKAKRRRELGAANAIEYVQAQIEEANAKRLRSTLGADYRSSLEELRSLIGLQPEEEIVFLDSLPIPIVNTRLSILEEKLLASHPSLLASQASVSAGTRGVTLAAMSPLPDFSLEYARQTLNGQGNFYTVGVKATIPLFSFLNDYGKIEEAKAESNIREASFDQTKRSLLLGLRSSFARYESAKENYELFEKTLLPQANELYRIARGSLQAGEATYLEFILAQRTLNETRINYINTLLELHQSYVALELAAGNDL